MARKMIKEAQLRKAVFLCLLPWHHVLILGVKQKISNFAETIATVENTCQLETINTIELDLLAQQNGVKTCSLDRFVVSTASGEIFMKGSPEAEQHDASHMHYFGTFSAPWFVYSALVDSLYYTDNPLRTSLYLVNDYCYYMWWLAASASKDSEAVSPLRYLLELYESITEMQAWQVRDGANFVFFLPYSITQVIEFERSRAGGGMLRQYADFICETFESALVITAENFQTNSLCKREKGRKALVAPFVPNVIDVKNQALSGSLEGMKRPFIPLEDRDILIYFMGRCSHRIKDPARRLRRHVVEVLAAAGPDVKLTCTESESKQRVPFSEMLSDMERSVYCLIIPTNSQTARGLGEAMLAGCIPLFLGPPFAALPFSKDLKYAEFSLSYYLEDHEKWTAASSTEVKGAPLDQQTMALTLTARGKAIDERFQNVHEVIETLRGINQESKWRSLQAVQKARHRFLYYPELSDDDGSSSHGGKESATDLLMLKLCQHINVLANE